MGQCTPYRRISRRSAQRRISAALCSQASSSLFSRSVSGHSLYVLDLISIIQRPLAHEVLKTRRMDGYSLTRAPMVRCRAIIHHEPLSYWVE